MSPDGRRRFVEFPPQTRLATDGLVALAAAGMEHPLEAAAVAKRGGADVGEMRGVLGSLATAGLVEACGSDSSSFRLSRGPQSVSLYDIAEAVGESFDVCCLLNGHSEDGDACSGCPLASLCADTRGEVVALLKGRTVGDLLVARA